MTQAITTVVGLDVSDRHTHVFRTTRENPDQGERSKVRTRAAQLEAFFRSLPPCSQVVLEVGPHSRWIQRLARGCGQGHEVVVANSRRLRFIFAGTTKTDELDAQALAEVACVRPSLLHPIHHRREDTQRELNQLVARDELVQVRTKLINALRSLVKASGREPLEGCDTAYFLRRHGRDLLALGEAHLTALLGALEGVQAQIETLELALDRLARAHPLVELLCQIHGVGTITALAFVLVIEDPDRFRRARKVGAYLGLVPRLDQSGAVCRQLGITKAGHPLLRRLLVQAAHSLLRKGAPDSDLRRHGEALRKRAGPGAKGATQRAAVAVARKLAVVMLRLWQTGEVYRPLRLAA